MKKLWLVLLVIVFAVLAVMFDWFGSRDVAQSGVEATRGAVDKIQETGDAISQTIQQLNETKKEAN